MNTRTIGPIIALSLLCGCPDGGPGDPGETDPTATSGDGDGDGDGSGDGDGDGDAAPDLPGSGDGDGDGDGDGGAANMSLEVESDGVRLGYLQTVNEHTLSIWDDVAGILYQLNDVTGYVATSPTYYHLSDDCTGARHIWSGVQLDICDSAPSAYRPRAYGWSGDNAGLSEASTIEIGDTPPVAIVYQSVYSGGACISLPANVTDTCVYEMTASAMIPTSFALPIVIVEN